MDDRKQHHLAVLAAATAMLALAATATATTARPGRADAAGAAATWARLIGGDGDDALALGRANPDGSADLVGTVAAGTASERGWIVRIDANGVPVLHKVVGSESLRVEAIAPTADGGYLIHGTQLLPFNQDQTFVAKMSAAHAMTWQKTIGDALTRYTQVLPLADGGALLTGTIYSNQTFSSAQMLTRLSGTGAVLWRRDLAYGAGFALSAGTLADGGFALVGTLQNANGTYDAYVARLDAAGVVQWDARLDAGGNESGAAVTELAGGALVVSGLATPYGSSDSDVLLVRLSAAGAVTAHRTLGGSGWETGTATLGGDGKLYLVGGTTSFGQGAWDGWLSELDAVTLEPAWSRTIGSQYDDFVAFQPDTVGGGYLGSGTTRAGGPFHHDVFVGKLAAGASSLTWQRLIGAGKDEAGAAVRLADAGVLVTGTTASFPPAPQAPLGTLAVPELPLQDDALVVRLDANGALAGCAIAQPGPLIVAAFSPEVATPPLAATAVAPAGSGVSEVSGAISLPVADGALASRDACLVAEVLDVDATGSPAGGPAPLVVSFSSVPSGGFPPYSYSWSFGDGTPASAQANPSHTYASSGAFTATLTVSDTAGGTATDSVSVTVGVPECTLQCLAEVTATGSSGADFFFSGGYKASNCGGSPAYLWSFGDGATAATKDAAHTYAAAGTYSWSLAVTLDGRQCGAAGSVTAVGVQDIAVLVGAAALADGQAAAVAFGNVGQGHPGSTRTFTVRNDGAADLAFGAVTVPAGFTVTEPLVGPLQPGASDTFTVRLDSAAPGARSGQLVINSNDPDEQPFNVPLAGAVVAPASLPRRFDFGTAASPVAGSHVRVSETTAYSAPQGYGWTAGSVQSRDRGSGGDLARDFAFSSLATFEVDVAYGAWDVTITLGDAAAAHDRMGVLLEGAGVDEISTRAGEWITRTYRVQVDDGRVTLGLDDLGGTDANVVIAAVAVAPPYGEGRFDFGTPTSPVAAGYARVEPATAYSPATGFGWLGGTRDARDRVTGGDLNRDFVFTQLATFALDVPPGVWDVAVTLGDETTAHDEMGVFLEGELAWQVATTPGGAAIASFRVRVLDGQLTVLLDDLGGADPNVVLNALTVTPAPAARFDFGTATSPVGWGSVRVTEATPYGAQQPYGWISGTRVARDRGTGTEVTRDFVYSALAEYAVDVPAGRYDVKVTLGDATAAHDQMGVFLEGSQVDSVTTAANQFVTRTYRVAVADGQLRVKLDDLGGADPNVVLNSLEVVPAAVLRIDFGTATSPVAADYVRATDATAYAAIPGYGWLSGTRAARDRATADPLARDFVFSALATFAVDVPRGSHQVTVRLGDATAAHEQMGVHFEGHLFESVTTAAGQVVTRTTFIDVQDGQLTVLLDDLGGADANVVINALEVR